MITHYSPIRVFGYTDRAADSGTLSPGLPCILRLVTGKRPQLAVLVASSLLLLACQPDIRPGDSNQVVMEGTADGANWNAENFFETATVEEVTDFLEAGADLEARTGYEGATPLHWAARVNGNPAVIAALLQAGANLEARDDIGRTPLHMAVGFNELAVIAALLQAGADLEARTDRGWTPLHVAAGFKDPDAMAALDGALSPPPPPGVARYYSPFYGTETIGSNENPAVIAALLQAGADLEARTDRGWTPLHAAAGFKDPAVIAALLKAGADLEVRTDEGLSPLHVATSWNDNPAIVAALLEAGANPEAARTEREATPQAAGNENSVRDRFDLDLILNIAAGVILAGVVLGMLYVIVWFVLMLIAES